MTIINIKGLKREFIIKDIKMGKDSLSYFIKQEEERMKKDIEIISRNIKIHGRKIANKDDIANSNI